MSARRHERWRSALYVGAVTHTRRDSHARRSFRYPLYVAALDLDELTSLDRELRLFSYRRRNMFALFDRDYAGHGGPSSDLRGSLHDLLAAHRIPIPATTRLVTNLRIANYVFNPVSFFLNYDARGALESVIAEVNNTYGGRVRYVLGAEHRIAHPRRVGFRHPRELFVSPFLHGPRDYELWFDAPLDGDHLVITMHVDTPDAVRVLVAHLAGTRRAFGDRALATLAIRYPLMTAQVIGLIHLEALRMRLAGVPYRRPAADHRPLDDVRVHARPIEPISMSRP